MPIVDYTNLFIFGLTVALAWQLPDKPDYSADSSEDKISRKHSNITIEKLNKHSKAPPISAAKYDLHNHANYHDYMDNMDYKKYLLMKIGQKLQTNGYNYVLNDKLKSRPVYKQRYFNGHENVSDILHSDLSPKYQPYYRYPALRMRRSVSSMYEDKPGNVQSLKQHISSRIQLYGKISKYLDAYV